MNVFDESDYRKILRKSLLERKEHVSKEFSFQNMAKACRIQKTYLSTVLAGNGHLNADQVFLACDFLGLNSLETEYTGLSHEKSRSVSIKRKRVLDEQIAKIKQKASQTEAHLETKSAGATYIDYSEYYLDPLIQVVHIFLTIDRYRKDVSLIREQINISSVKLTKILTTLTKLNLVSLANGEYQVIQDTLHLSAEEAIYPAHNKLLRIKSLDKCEDEAKTYSFSAVFSSDEATKDQIKNQFLKFIKSCQEQVDQSTQQNVYQLNFDLLQWD